MVLFFKKPFEYNDIRKYQVNKLIETMISQKHSNLCAKHGGELQFFCLDDQEQICAHCAIKGVHQRDKHTIVTFDELKTKNLELIEGISSKVQELELYKESKSNKKLKRILEKNAQRIIKKSKQNLLDQYEEIIELLKKSILNQFSNFEQQILDRVNNEFNNTSNDEFNRYIQNIDEIEEELNFLKKLFQKKSNSNQLSIFQSLERVKKRYEDTRYSNQDLVQKINSLKNSKLEIQWNIYEIMQGIKLISNVSNIMPEITIYNDIQSQNQGSEIINSQTRQKIRKTITKKVNKSQQSQFLTISQQSLSRLKSEISKRNAINQSISRDKTMNSIFQEEKSNYFPEARNVSRPKQLGKKLNSISRKDGYKSHTRSMKSNLIMSQGLDLSKNEFLQIQKQKSMIRPNKNNIYSNNKIKDRTKIYEVNNEIIDQIRLKQIIYKALENIKINRITFRNNTFKGNVYEQLRAILSYKLNDKFYIDLRSNNMKKYKHYKEIIELLKAKNIKIIC